MARILDPADPADDFQLRDLAYTARIMRRARCAGCGCPVITETYLDLEPLGLQGVACERCVGANTHGVENLEESLC